MQFIMENWPQLILSVGGIFAVVASWGSYQQQKIAGINQSTQRTKIQSLTQENNSLNIEIKERAIELANLQEEYTHFATGDISFPTVVLLEDSTKQFFQVTLKNTSEYPIYTCRVEFPGFPDKNGNDRYLKFDTLAPFTELHSQLKIIPITDKSTKKYTIEMFTPSATYIQCYMLKYIHGRWASAWHIAKKNGKWVDKPIEGRPNSFTTEIEYENEFKDKHYDNGMFTKDDMKEFEKFYGKI